MNQRIEYHDVLRLSRDQIRDLVATHLLPNPVPADGGEPCHALLACPIVLLEICYPNGIIGSYQVSALSAGPTGMGVVHGKFVYPGSTCRVFLQAMGDDVMVASGRITRCRLLEGRLHEIGIAFDEPIDASRVMAVDATRPAPDETEPIEHGPSPDTLEA